MNECPLVTIGIPNYNYSHYIVETLDSVASQTYPNIELIIVDDLSTDNSIEIINNWISNYKGNIKIKFIKNKSNVGLTKACNIILKKAKGKYFQPLDADDIILRTKIEKQVPILENSINTALVYSNVAVINEKGEVTNADYCSRINYDKNEMPSGNIFNDLLTFNFISLPSVLINTEMAKAIGGFDETLRVQDYYMWLKLSKQHNIEYASGNYAYYRVHSISMSNLPSTNVSFAESVISLKYRYFDQAPPRLKKVIAKNIQNSSVFLYENKYPAAKKWLTLAFRLNPGFKTAVYFVSIRLGVPFTFFEMLKSNFRRNDSR